MIFTIERESTPSDRALFAAATWIDANRRRASDEYREAAISLLSEIDTLLKGTIYERSQTEVER